MTDSIRLKSYRVKGGGIVTVTRGDRTRRYRVSLLRLARIAWLLSAWPKAWGYYGKGNCFDVKLASPKGYREALRDVRIFGGHKARALFPRERTDA